MSRALLHRQGQAFHSEDEGGGRRRLPLFLAGRRTVEYSLGHVESVLAGLHDQSVELVTLYTGVDEGQRSRLLLKEAAVNGKVVDDYRTAFQFPMKF